MDSENIIARLRREAGFSQKTLAQLLNVTDKAVSKWERGLCLPDTQLLTKLSMLLDADIEYLLSGMLPYGEHAWRGLLVAEDLEHEVGGKPLLHYLLSYFMLAGIREIDILTRDRQYVRGLNLEQYGLKIGFDLRYLQHTMVVRGKFLLFGANLTRYFLNFMHGEQNIRLTLGDREIPICFVHRETGDLGVAVSQAEPRNLGRGILCLPLETPEQIRDASAFVQIYEKQHPKIADLMEISRLRFRT